MLDFDSSKATPPSYESGEQGREGLFRQDDGTWKAEACRVPLVGVGRVVDNISKGLVSVLGSTGGLNNVVDLDITNAADLSGLDINALGNQILSVKDMNRTYSKGQQVGFVLGADNGNSVLSLDVLKLFVISIYKDNELVSSHNVSEDGKTLNLNLIKLTSAGNSGQQVLSIEADGDFDEVMLGVTGISASLADMTVYYAFVGEAPMKEIYSTDGASIREDKPLQLDNGWTGVMDAHPEKLLAPGEEQGVHIYTDLLTSIIGIRYLTVDFGDELYFPAGTELGFTYSQGSVLNLSILNTVELIPYDSDWNEIEKDKFSTGGLLGLSAIGGGKGAYSIVTSEAGTKALKIRFTGIKVDLGALDLLRVYHRDPVVVDPTSYFTAAENVKTYKSSFRFMEPQPGTGRVEFSLTASEGETVTAENPAARMNGSSIVGMHVGAKYTVTSTFIPEDGRSPFTTVSVIERVERDMPEATYMIEPDFELASESVPGGITLISGLENAGNITDGDINNAAVLTKVLSLIDYSTVAAVKTADGSTVGGSSTTRVGFAIQPNSELLGLKALDFFRIVLYNGDEKVAVYVPAENEGVSLGLVGDGGKIAVTALTDEPFDRVELQTAGVLSLQLSTLKIYYAFYEEGVDVSDVSDSGIGDLCTELLSPTSDGLALNYDHTRFTSLAMVGNSMNNLGNIVDDDRDSYATIPITANVAGKMEIAVTFNPVKTSQWVGMMVSRPTGVVSAELLSQMKMEIYNDGILQETVVQQAGLLGLELLGSGDRYYVEAYPRQGGEFDEIRLSLPAVLSVADNLLVYGVYLRPDENGNGIPDCSEDTDKDDPDYMIANPSEYHICQSSGLTVKVEGGKTGESYTLAFTDAAGEQAGVFEKELLSQGRVFSFSSGEITSLSPDTGGAGVYTVKVTGQSASAILPDNIKVYVHPSKTTWTGAAGTDWNEWDNWSEGAPWSCTDVLIPGGCTNYPVLHEKDGTALVSNLCGRLQLASGAEIAGTHYLDYDRAWVDVILPNGRYSMFSAPLKDTYTGDMFVGSYAQDGSEYSACWPVLDEVTCPVRRFSPPVYQRVWNRSVQNAGQDGYTDVDIDSGFWSDAYNLVSDRYGTAKGILLRPGDEGYPGESEFRLPKEHGEYDYYDIESEVMLPGMSEYVDRPDIGRFIYEDECSEYKNASSGETEILLHVLLENKRPSDTYLAGNPFMCHLDVGKFFETNTAVKEIKFLEYSESEDRYYYRTVEKGASSGEKIAPMQGFLVTVGGIYAETSRFSFYVHFTSEMMTLGK